MAPLSKNVTKYRMEPEAEENGKEEDGWILRRDAPTRYEYVTRARSK